MRHWMRRASCALALVTTLLGCGGNDAPTPEQSEPFRAAIVEYLRVGTMDMKPDTFETLTIDGAKATAKVHMATKDDLYGMKPVWAFWFAKNKDGQWTVVRHER